mmetsp:Transcript_26563/g.33176  ORF Transcript_26563/g.33176 Transcript_26563/m.33176 type:complete len:268 (-) Transcript_26563:95-898(-)
MDDLTANLFHSEGNNVMVYGGKCMGKTSILFNVFCNFIEKSIDSHNTQERAVLIVQRKKIEEKLPIEVVDDIMVQDNSGFNQLEGEPKEWERPGMHHLGMKYLDSASDLQWYLSTLQLLPDEEIPSVLGIDDFDLLLKAGESEITVSYDRFLSTTARTLALLDHAVHYITSRIGRSPKVLMTCSAELNKDRFFKTIVQRWVPKTVFIKPSAENGDHRKSSELYQIIFPLPHEKMDSVVTKEASYNAFLLHYNNQKGKFFIKINQKIT